MFNKKRADERKLWLEEYNKASYLDTSHPRVQYEDFVDKELIHFSVYDCERSIPNMVDGLKISQRKILYCAFKRKLVSEIKVAQFSGYVSEHSEYHHGENSLHGAIVGMAQNFVGSNNINVLLPNGQFGSRMQGGEDSASERYIFTQLNTITRTMFPESDEPILRYLCEDGHMIEPNYYVPILPFVLCNGISGIGTGFSTSIPPFDPKQIVRYLRNKIRGEAIPTETFVPYYESFRGTVTSLPDDAKKFAIKGVYEILSPTTVRITELPVGTWTMPYMSYLDGLVLAHEDKQGKKVTPVLKDVVSNSTDKLVDIHVTFSKPTTPEDMEKTLKLSTTVSITNMHLFDASGKLHKYQNVQEIIDAFYDVRMDTYTKRKERLLVDLEHIMTKISNKALYIQLVLDGKVDLRRKTMEEINTMLIGHGLHKMDETYDYLVKMPMMSVAQEHVDKLLREKGETSQRLETLKTKTLSQMYIEDLDAFDDAYQTYVQKRIVEHSHVDITVKTKVNAGKAKV